MHKHSHTHTHSLTLIGKSQTQHIWFFLARLPHFEHQQFSLARLEMASYVGNTADLITLNTGTKPYLVISTVLTFFKHVHVSELVVWPIRLGNMPASYWSQNSTRFIVQTFLLHFFWKSNIKTMLKSAVAIYTLALECFSSVVWSWLWKSQNLFLTFTNWDNFKHQQMSEILGDTQYFSAWQNLKSSLWPAWISSQPLR